MFNNSENIIRFCDTDHVFGGPPMYKIETTEFGWQRCPICSGVGRIPAQDCPATFKACDVCAGKKIISTATGKPPAD